MASPIQQQTSTFTGCPPPESSDFTVATNATTGTVAEPAVNASAAAMAAIQDLARELSPSEEITFTIDPDSIPCTSEKIRITQLKGMLAVICRSLRESSQGHSVVPRDVLECQLHVVDGIVAQEQMQECINSLQKENGGLQQKIRGLLADIGDMQAKINRLREENRNLDYGKRDFQRAAIRLERKNSKLKKDMEQVEAEREAEIDVGDGSSTESDGEGPSRKRKRDEI